MMVKALGKRTKRRRRWVASVLLVLAAVLVLLMVVWLHDLVRNRVWHRERDRQLRGHIWEVWRALLKHEYDHGLLPYHADGQEKALYLLKPYVKDVSVFDSDFADRDINGPARWDDEERRLVGGDYDYINWPELYSRSEWEYLVILAEKTGVRVGGKDYLTLEQGPDLYLYDPAFPQEIVGGMLFREPDP
jgi:hypothetical protein